MGWLLPENPEACNEEEWDHRSKYLIKDVMNKVDSLSEMYGQCAIAAKQQQIKWSRAQFAIGFTATSVAFITASSLPEIIANSTEWDEDLIIAVLSLAVGFLSVLLTAAAEVQKKGNFGVKIHQYSEIRDDYQTLQMYVESEIRFHKTKAANLETKVSRILQELAVTHSSVMVPAHIEQRVLQKAADFTSEEAVSKCMQGMGRDSIVAHQALVAEAQRRMRRRKISNACGIDSLAMNELTAGVTKQLHKKKKLSNAKKKRKASNRISATPQPVDELSSAMAEYVEMIDADADEDEADRADEDNAKIPVEEAKDDQDVIVDEISDVLGGVEEDFDE